MNTITPKFRVGDLVKWGHNMDGQVKAICLRGDSILNAVRFQINDVVGKGFSLGPLVLKEDRYIVETVNQYIGFTISEFDGIGSYITK